MLSWYMLAPSDCIFSYLLACYAIFLLLKYIHGIFAKRNLQHLMWVFMFMSVEIRICLIFSVAISVRDLNFFFSVQMVWFPLLCLTVDCSVSMYQFIFCWLLLAYFCFTHCILLLCLIPFYIFQLFVKLLCSSILLHFFEHLCDPFLDCLFIHPLVLFLRFCLVPLFGTYSSVSSFYLILYAYFCVLAMLVTFSDLVDVAL